MSSILVCTTKVHGPINQAEECRALLVDKEGFSSDIDFNNIIPPPPFLNIDVDAFTVEGALFAYGLYMKEFEHVDLFSDEVFLANVYRKSFILDFIRKKYETWDHQPIGLKIDRNSTKSIPYSDDESNTSFAEYVLHGKIYYHHLARYGYATLYGWRCDHWGDDMNADGGTMSEIVDNGDGTGDFSFHYRSYERLPYHIIMALHKKFDMLSFTGHWYEPSFMYASMGIWELRDEDIYLLVAGDVKEESCRIVCEEIGLGYENYLSILADYGYEDSEDEE